MSPSGLTKIVRERTSGAVREQLNNPKISDPQSIFYRNVFFLAQFNIIKTETVLKQPFTDLKVPIHAWPLLDLPTGKLEGNLLLNNIYA